MSHGKLPQIENIAQKNYFELQVFSSIEFIKMIIDLETEFDIMFSGQDLKSAAFQTLNGIAEIIHDKLSKR